MDDCCVLHNGNFGNLALSLLTGGSDCDNSQDASYNQGYSLQLASSFFVSEDIRQMFQSYRSMLAHEYRAEVSQQVAAHQLSEVNDEASLQLDVVSVAAPLIRLKEKFTPSKCTPQQRSSKLLL